MPRRIGSTVVPRNPVVRAVANRRGGVHERSRTAQRQRSRARDRELIADWREELEFERKLNSEDDSSL